MRLKKHEIEKALEENQESSHDDVNQTNEKGPKEELLELEALMKKYDVRSIGDVEVKLSRL